MVRKLALFLLGLLAGAVLTAGVGWYLYTEVFLPQFASRAISERVDTLIESFVGSSVEIGDITLQAGRGSLLLSNVQLGSATQPFCSISRVEVFGKGGIFGLQQGKIQGVVLEAPRVYLYAEPEGEWNVEQLFYALVDEASGEWSFLHEMKTIPPIRMTNGQVLLQQAPSQNVPILNIKQAQWIPAEIAADDKNRNLLVADGVTVSWMSDRSPPFIGQWWTDDPTAPDFSLSGFDVEIPGGRPLVHLTNLTIKVAATDWFFEVGKIDFDLQTDQPDWQARIETSNETAAYLVLGSPTVGQMKTQWLGDATLRLGDEWNWSANLTWDAMQLTAVNQHIQPFLVFVQENFQGYRGSGVLQHHPNFFLKTEGLVRHDPQQEPLPVILHYDQRSTPALLALQVEQYQGTLHDIAVMAGSPLDWLRGVPGKTNLDRIRIDIPLAETQPRWDVNGSVEVPSIRHPQWGQIKQLAGKMRVKGQGTQLFFHGQQMHCSEFATETGLVLNDVQGDFWVVADSKVQTVTTNWHARQGRWQDQLEGETLHGALQVDFTTDEIVLQNNMQAQSLQIKQVGKFNEVRAEFGWDIGAEIITQTYGALHARRAYLAGWTHPLNNLWLTNMTGTMPSKHPQQSQIQGHYRASCRQVTPYGDFEWSERQLELSSRIEGFSLQHWDINLPGVWNLEAHGVWSPEQKLQIVLDAYCPVFSWDLPLTRHGTPLVVGPGEMKVSLVTKTRDLEQFFIERLSADWGNLNLSLVGATLNHQEGVVEQLAVQGSINSFENIFKTLEIPMPPMSQWNFQVEAGVNWNAEGWSADIQQVVLGNPQSPAIHGPMTLIGSPSTDGTVLNIQPQFTLDFGHLFALEKVSGKAVLDGVWKVGGHRQPLHNDFWFERIAPYADLTLQIYNSDLDNPWGGLDLFATTGVVRYIADSSGWSMDGSLAGGGFRYTRYKTIQIHEPSAQFLTREEEIIAGDAHKFRWRWVRPRGQDLQVQHFTAELHPNQEIQVSAEGYVRITSDAWQPSLAVDVQMDARQDVSLYRHLWGYGHAQWKGTLEHIRGTNSALLNGVLTTNNKHLNLTTRHSPDSPFFMQLQQASGTMSWKETIDVRRESVHLKTWPRHWDRDLQHTRQMVQNARRNINLSQFGVVAALLVIDDLEFRQCGATFEYINKVLNFDGFRGTTRETTFDLVGFLVFHPDGPYYRFGGYSSRVTLSKFFKESETPELPIPLTEMEIRLATNRPGQEPLQEFILFLAPMKRSMDLVMKPLREIFPPLGVVEDTLLTNATSIGLRRVGDGPLSVFYPGLEEPGRHQ